MITTIKKIILGSLLICSVPALALFAATPVLTASGTGDNNNVTIHVTGADPNAPVVLYFNSSASGMTQSRVVGTTDTSGNFSGTVDTRGLSIGNTVPVYVIVNGYQSGSVSWPYSVSTTTTYVSFSPGSLTLNSGQHGTITLSGGYGNNVTYSVSSNSNSGVINPTISGNTLTVSAVGSGTSNVTVCPSSGACSILPVTVTGSTSGAPTASQSTVVLNQGTQGSVTLSGGTAPYTVYTLNGSGLNATVSGNTLYLTGSMTGSNTVNVCSANGGCTSVLVNVQPQPSTPGNGQFSVYIPVTVGQSTPVMLVGGNGGSFYLQSPVSYPAIASLSGGTLTLNGQASGTGSVTVCQTNGSCLPINVVVSSGLGGTGGGYFFEKDLYVGTSGQDVTELQTRLKEEGYFSPAVTGYFGGATKASVQRYQRDHGISATGYVGTLTRAELNK